MSATLLARAAATPFPLPTPDFTAAAAKSTALAVPRLAFIDVGWRKLPYLLALRERLQAQLDGVFFTRRRLLRQLISDAGAPLFPQARAPQATYAIGDDELREALGAKLARRYDDAGLQKARQRLAELEAFLVGERIDVIFVWNGYNKLCSSLAIFLARRHGLRVIFGEHGYLPGTMQLDALGVNQLSSATAEVQAGRAWLPPQAELDARVDAFIRLHRARQPRADRVAVPAVLRGQWRTRTELRLREVFRQRRLRLLQALYTRSLPQTLPALPERFVLLPLQVRSDSQLQMHSPVFGNDLLRVIQRLRSALREIDPSLRLVVKLHPRENPKQQIIYGELTQRMPDVLFTLGHPLPALLDAAAAVVTINSTVGFEAMLYDKPVIALGRNFYVAPGLVETVKHESELPTALRLALATPPDATLRRGFLRWVCAQFLVDGVYDDFSERSLAATAARILALSCAPLELAEPIARAA